MVSKTDIEKLERFSKGLTDAEEEKYLKKDFNEYLKNNSDDNFELSPLLDRIHHIIHSSENRKKRTVVRRIYRWYSVAAAVLLIPIIVGSGLWFSGHINKQAKMIEAPVESRLFAPLGSRISFSLPDGTQGWLNSGSTLEYSLPFNQNRHITLDGEAWFDVSHDSEYPFEIATNNSKVKVLGTKFNVNAYPDEQYLEVVLEEGCIEFITKGLSSAVKMKPNERLVLSEGCIKMKTTDACKYSAWKDGKLVFRGDSMDEVARRIGRWYNVDVKVVDDKLKEYSFRGIFEDDSLEEVIRYISMTSPIRYKIIDRVQLDDGTIQKKQVMLYKKKM